LDELDIFEWVYNKERKIEKNKSTVKITESRLSFFLFSFSLLFSYQFIFHFSIFRTMGLGLEVIGHTVTSVTSNSVLTTLITGLKRRE